MSKATRKRQANEDKKEQEQQLLTKKKQHKTRLQKGAVIALCVCIAVAALGALSWVLVKQDKDSGRSLRAQVAVKTRSYTVTNAMMTYFFAESYNRLIDFGTLDKESINPEVSLKKQKVQDDMTYFSYVLLVAESNVREALLRAEAAKDAGMSLTAAETAAVTKKAAALTPSDFGRGLTRADIESCLSLEALAAKYYDDFTAKQEPDAAAIDAYYAAHENDFRYYAYKSYTFNRGGDARLEKTAKDGAAALKACRSAAEFDEALTTFLTEQGVDSVAATVRETQMEDITYTDTDLGHWAFAADRKVGDTFMETTDARYTVYLITALPQRNESRTSNFRHILVELKQDGQYQTSAALQARAQEILNEWKAGAATEDSFAALAKKYSDAGDATDGGLAENIYVEDPTTEDVAKWTMNNHRTPGDTTVIQSVNDNGYQVVYYIGDGLVKWRDEVRVACATARYDAAFKAWESKYPAEFAEEIVNKIDK